MSFDPVFQSRRCETFRALHRREDPLRLFNVWDIMSARAVDATGAAALATSSWAIADSLGFSDGEALPFDTLLDVVQRISTQTTALLSVDLERGYAADLSQLADNVARLVRLGVVGINLEDGLADGGVRDASAQGERIRAAVTSAADLGADIFVNARTDVFFTEGQTEAALQAAIERASVYADAGAAGFFAPGLTDPLLIRRLCQATSLPVNLMVDPKTMMNDDTGLGAARLSLGPAGYFALRSALDEIVASTLKPAST